MSRILSYRGLLEDEAQDTILLSTKKGEAGYRIKKLQIIAERPGTANAEHLVQVWKDEQTVGAAITDLVNFSDNRLLGVAYVAQHGTNKVYTTTTILFDNDVFNQDIYITHHDIDSGEACNYYLELEVIKLSEQEAMVATIMNIRNG